MPADIENGKTRSKFLALTVFLIVIGVFGLRLLSAQQRGGQPKQGDVGSVSVPTRPKTTAPPSPSASAMIDMGSGTNPRAAGANAHSIGQIGLSEENVIAGSAQPVILTADIFDSAVIASGVNLLQVFADGNQAVLGTLHDDGLNGDFVAGDKTFSIKLSFVGFQTGTTILRVSAAFQGSLKRVQSDDIPIVILPSLSTAGWTSASDSQSLFSLMMPPEWNLAIRESSPDADDVFATKTVEFQTADNQAVFYISVYSKAGWLHEQSNPLPPQYLGENSVYIFAYGRTQSGPEFSGLTSAQISQQLNQVVATFKIN